MMASEYMLKESRIQIPNHLSSLLKEHTSNILKEDSNMFNGVADAMDKASKTGNNLQLAATKHRFGEYLKDKHGLDYNHADFLINKFNPEDFRNGNVAKNITENKYINNNKFKYNIDSRYNLENNPLISDNTKNKISNTIKLGGGVATLSAAAYASQ